LYRARTKRKLKEKLKGKGLGDVSDGEQENELDPMAWVERMRKKELAAKKAKELDAQDQAFEGKASEYTAGKVILA
jgi:hypothetical protein